MITELLIISGISKLRDRRKKKHLVQILVDQKSEQNHDEPTLPPSEKPTVLGQKIKPNKIKTHLGKKQDHLLVKILANSQSVDTVKK